MPAVNTDTLRVQIDARLVEALDALAKARTATDGKKITKAELVTEALEAYINVVPRLEQVGKVADLMTAVRKLEANLSDQIERGFAAMSEANELRQENEILNAAALYSLDSSEQI